MDESEASLEDGGLDALRPGSDDSQYGPRLAAGAAVAASDATMEKGVPPVPRSTRTVDLSGELSSGQRTAPDGAQRPALHGAGGIALPEQPAQPVDLRTLWSWAVAMFCGGRENLVLLAGDPFIETITTDLICSMKAVVTALFNDFPERICSSPEKPELRLSQEEALGHLAGSLVVGELLASEARPIGKRVDFFASKEKETHEKEKEGARQKKKNLRKRKGAALDPELENKCRKLDEDAEVSHADRLAKERDVGLPKKRSIIVERAPAPAPADVPNPRVHALDRMFGSQAAWDAMEAAEAWETLEMKRLQAEWQAEWEEWDENMEEQRIDPEQVEVDVAGAKVRYAHKLRALKAAFPEEKVDCS